MKSTKAFTLLELIIVVIIIAILVSIALPIIGHIGDDIEEAPKDDRYQPYPEERQTDY